MLTFMSYHADLKLHLSETLKCPQRPVICPFNDFMNQSQAL